MSSLGVVVSSLLAVIAIFGKEVFIKLKFKYEMSKIDQKINGELMQVFRVKIKNHGKRSAKDVLVAVVDIFDKKNLHFNKREDFIHMPPEWTHYPMEKKVRNIAAGEEVYVDIGLYDLSDQGLKLFTNPRTDSESLFAINNDARITLRLTEGHGFTEEIVLDFRVLLSGGGLEIKDTKTLSRG